MGALARTAAEAFARRLLLLVLFLVINCVRQLKYLLSIDQFLQIEKCFTPQAVKYILDCLTITLLIDKQKKKHRHFFISVTLINFNWD